MQFLRLSPDGSAGQPGLYRSHRAALFYCSTQHRKNFFEIMTRYGWLRGAHNGGSHFRAPFPGGSRVHHDTLACSFTIPMAVMWAPSKDYGYEFHGWRGGVMVVKAKMALYGRPCRVVPWQGPQKGSKLEAFPL